MISILVADDSAAELEAIVFLLKKQQIPAVIRTAKNGDEAWQMFAKQPADLLITDIKMPYVDGLDLARRAKEVSPALRTLIISAYEDFSYAKQAISIGVEEYLLKPIDPAEFFRVMERLAGQIGERKEKESAKQALRGLPETMNSKIREVCLYIQEHYREELSLDILAAKVYINRDYLSRLFKKETGQNIGAYIRQVRMEEAKRLLLSTSLKVSAVASQTGYPNSAYFTKAFCDYAGVTPERFREMKGAE